MHARLSIPRRLATSHNVSRRARRMLVLAGIVAGCAGLPMAAAFAGDRPPIVTSSESRDASTVANRGSAASSPKARVAESAPPPAPAPRAPVVRRASETRYTVRKRIESMEPRGWLQKFGTIEVRPRPSPQPAAPSATAPSAAPEP